MQLMNSASQHKATRRGFARVVVAALAGVLFFGAVGVDTAEAGKKTKSKLSREARLLAFDTEAGTMTVKERGKKIVYKVKFEGSVMTRTTATINARPVKLHEIPLKARVNIYWRPDEANKKKRFARKVDALNIPKELLEEK
ncbi:MAG: hypothetical protein QF570_18790 [Myxococcota bacterium]|jgi:hypothetical protein|nr:hypothetical protein [Myxococcota bacterium]